jgi:hypothetical protein
MSTAARQGLHFVQENAVEQRTIVVQLFLDPFEQLLYQFPAFAEPFAEQCMRINFHEAKAREGSRPELEEANGQLLRQGLAQGRFS